MLQIKKILFPTDYSACAKRAFEQAARLADWHEADLHVLNVIEAPNQDFSRILEDAQLTEEDIAEELRIVLRTTPQRPQQPAVIQARIESPSASTAILGYAEDHDIDLIVMGTHGRRGANRLLLGSVAEKVVRLASCSVLTVCTGEAPVPAQMVERILVPIDFSEHARLALVYAAELAQTYGARLDLLHVVKEEPMPAVYGVVPATPLPLLMQRAEQGLVQLIRREIGFEHVVSTVTSGDPATEILAYAAAHDINLIVIASHGLTGLKHLLLGSIAEKVVRQAACPVFTVKSFGKSLLPQQDEQQALEPGGDRTPAPVA